MWQQHMPAPHPGPVVYDHQHVPLSLGESAEFRFRELQRGSHLLRLPRNLSVKAMNTVELCVSLPERLHASTYFYVCEIPSEINLFCTESPGAEPCKRNDLIYSVYEPTGFMATKVVQRVRVQHALQARETSLASVWAKPQYHITLVLSNLNAFEVQLPANMALALLVSMDRMGQGIVPAHCYQTNPWEQELSLIHI